MSDALLNPPTGTGNPGLDGAGAETANAVQAGRAVVADAKNPATGKRKPGRPPTPGSKYSEFKAGAVGVTPNPARNTATVVPLVDPETIKKSLRGVIGALDNYTARKISRTAQRLEVSSQLATDLANSARLAPDELELIADLAGQVCAKHNMLGQYAPEAMLGMMIAGYGLRVASVMSELKRMESRLSKERAPAPPVASAPPPPEVSA